MSQEPKLPTVVYDGGLTDREHAIIEAHQWQLAHTADTSGAYHVIVQLLMLLPYDEVLAAIQKSERQP